MSDSDYDFDDDDDFIALTLKPKQPVETTIEQQQPTQTHAQSIQPPLSQYSNNELLVARGEVAVLRSKLAEIEKSKLAESQRLQEENNRDKLERESKIKALESSVKRLEDERKFLSVEVRNLNSKKKRKRISEEFQTQDVEMVDSPTSIEPSVQQTRTPSVTPVIPNSHINKVPDLEPLSKKPQDIIKIQPLVNKNDNVSLIDAILNQTIIGLSQPSISYLNKVSLHEDFRSTHLFIPKHESIAYSITQFLLFQKEIARLDHFISLIVKEFMILIKTLIETKDRFQTLPIPYVLSLLHAILIFRPSAISKPLKKELLDFCFQIVSTYESILKEDDVNFSEYYERHKRVAINVIQFKLIQEMALQFSFELIEIIITNLNYEDEDWNISIIEFIKKPLLELSRLILGKNSCINLVSSFVEILNCSIGLYEDNDEYPLINQEIINSLLSLLNDGISWKQNWLFCGLNRVIGNNSDAKSIESLTPNELSKYPKVVYPLDIESFEEKFKVQNQHESHLINLQLETLMFFEKLILTLSNGLDFFNKDTNYLKVLIITIAKQQELIFKSPRSNLTHLRSKLISSMIRILDLIWGLTTSGTNAISPLLPKDLTHVLLVVLSRIAFSNNQTGEEAVKFLYALRGKGYRKPVFNKYAEEQAREIGHVNIIPENANNDSKETSESSFLLRSLIHAEASFSNGLEFAYDDDVVELSRDLLEKCTTMEEADSLYMAMNVN